MPRYEDIIGSRHPQTRQKQPRGLAQAAARPVAYNRATDLLGGGKSRSGHGAGRNTAAALNHQKPAAFGVTICNKKEFAPYAEAFHLNERRVHVCR